MNYDIEYFIKLEFIKTINRLAAIKQNIDCLIEMNNLESITLTMLRELIQEI